MTPEEAAARCKRLTPRHAEVLALAATQGLTFDEIARALGIHNRTVRKYAGAARRALHAKTMTHAAHIATKGGLL